jgi:hypothetical protein
VRPLSSDHRHREAVRRWRGHPEADVAPRRSLFATPC